MHYELEKFRFQSRIAWLLISPINNAEILTNISRDLTQSSQVTYCLLKVDALYSSVGRKGQTLDAKAI